MRTQFEIFSIGRLLRSRNLIWIDLLKASCASLICVICSYPTGSFALENPSDYAKAENIRTLEEIIEQAKRTLNSLNNPTLATDRRGQRNRRMEGQPRIVNGRGTIYYPAVGALLRKSDLGEIAWCSGTLVTPDRFLIAAHCIVKDPVPLHYRIFFQSAGFFGVQQVDWQRAEYDFPKGDVAILTLSAQVQQISPELILTSNDPLAGTEGTIVGFGRTGGFNEDYGVKREGFIETDTCPASQGDAPLLCWKFSAEVQNGVQRSNTCNADSGGPLFVYETIGGHQVRYIAGVTSGGEAEDCLLGDQSYDADVFHYRKWIQQAAGLQENQNWPADTSFVDTNRDVLGGTFLLSDDRSTVDVPFDIQGGVQKLMIAMNGDDNGRAQNKFSFSVYKVDAGSDSTICSSGAPGQFGFCSITNPAAGHAKVVLQRQKGRGTVQITVTQLPSAH